MWVSQGWLGREDGFNRNTATLVAIEAGLVAAEERLSSGEKLSRVRFVSSVKWVLESVSGLRSPSEANVRAQSAALLQKSFGLCCRGQSGVVRCEKVASGCALERRLREVVAEAFKSQRTRRWGPTQLGLDAGCLLGHTVVHDCRARPKVLERVAAGSAVLVSPGSAVQRPVKGKGAHVEGGAKARRAVTVPEARAKATKEDAEGWFEVQRVGAQASVCCLCSCRVEAESAVGRDGGWLGGAWHGLKGHG